MLEYTECFSYNGKDNTRTNVWLTMNRIDIYIYIYICFNLDLYQRHWNIQKFIDFCDHSAVIFMVAWISLKELLFPISSDKKMSSIYLHHKYGLLSTFWRFFSYSFTINDIYRVKQTFSQLLCLFFSFKVFSLKLKILFFRTDSTNSVRMLVDASFLSLSSTRFLGADNPLPCVIFGYKPTTSIAHKKYCQVKLWE